MELIETIILFPYYILGFAFKWIVSLSIWFAIGYTIHAALSNLGLDFGGYEVRNPFKKKS